MSYIFTICHIMSYNSRSETLSCNCCLTGWCQAIIADFLNAEESTVEIIYNTHKCTFLRYKISKFSRNNVFHKLSAN